MGCDAAADSESVEIAPWLQALSYLDAESTDEAVLGSGDTLYWAPAGLGPVAALGFVVHEPSPDWEDFDLYIQIQAQTSVGRLAVSEPGVRGTGFRVAEDGSLVASIYFVPLPLLDDAEVTDFPVDLHAWLQFEDGGTTAAIVLTDLELVCHEATRPCE